MRNDTPINATTIDTLLAALQHVDYAAATESCDMVMKGGVTSGIVYPTAICRLATRFRFRSIGGTSAGALAAALTAAAEHARGSGGFQRFCDVPQWLGSGTHMRDLFQASTSTRGIFTIALAMLRGSSLLARAAFVSAAAIGAFPLTAIGWFVIAALLVAAPGWDRAPLNARVVMVLVAALAGIATAAVALGLRLLHAIRNDVPDNLYGICTGAERAPGAPVQPLTPWLADRIDYLAGRVPSLEAVSDRTEPLRFGDLWGDATSPAPYPGGTPILDQLNALAGRAVNLEMVTTDVTEGRPYRLPDGFDDLAMFFDPLEFRRLFPARVVAAMLRTAPATRLKHDDGRELVPFPRAADLPVIVAARMSMSFPLLFSAVPLYAREQHVAGGTERITKRWFSDGGLSSNIPMHFFDGPIPRWPTFAINLRGFPEGDVQDHADERRNVFRAVDVLPDIAAYDERGGARIMQFLASLLDAMRNWNDTTQLSLPGYRERAVEVAMSDAEGGLNLTMPEATLKSVVARGYCAAERFIDTFGTPDLDGSPAWQNHRHTRLRSTLLMQSEWSRRFGRAWSWPEARPSYADVTALTCPPVEPPSRPYTPEQIVAARAFAEHLARAPETLGEPSMTLTDAPYPAPELRARPRV